MNCFNAIFNKNILPDIKNNITKYQFKLSESANKEIKKYEFNHWINTKKWLDPSFQLRLEFNNLYFNFRLNELISTSETVRHKDYVNLKKIWITDYVNKFWTLNEKFHSETNMSQEEFERFFKTGEII